MCNMNVMFEYYGFRFDNPTVLRADVIGKLQNRISEQANVFVEQSNVCTTHPAL